MLVGHLGALAADLKTLMRMNEAIFESARSPMVVADEKGLILKANKVTSEVFGYSQVRVRLERLRLVKPQPRTDTYIYIHSFYVRSWSLILGQEELAGANVTILMPSDIAEKHATFMDRCAEDTHTNTSKGRCVGGADSRPVPVAACDVCVRQ
jgi:PAS domain-containing protein